MDVISCMDALAQGKTRFFTGKPCKYGHIVERMVSSGGCVECLKNRRQSNKQSIYANLKAWRKANPEKVAAQARRYVAKHPETSQKAKAKHRAANLDKIQESDRLAKARWRKANPEKQKERLRRYYERQNAAKEA